MIFKTINSSVDETRKTLALFNKDWDTYKRNWQNANGVFGKIGSVFTPANAITKSDIEAIKAYNTQIDSCVTSQTAFNRTMLNASPAAQNLVASYNGGKVSAQGMATAQNAAEASTIGLTIAQTALSAAIGMGIGLLVSLVVKGIDKLIHANEEAIEKAEELRRKYEEFKSTNESNVTTLKRLEKEFKELSNGVSQYGDNVSLTTEQYERYKEIIQQIVGMSPSLSEGYSTENGYIADKNGLLERAIELQEQEYRNELRKITNLDNLKTSMSGYIAEYKKAFNGGLVTDDMSAISTTTATDLSNALYQVFNLNGSGKHNYDNTEKIARKIIESLGIEDVNSEIQKYINKNGIFESSWFFRAYADTIAKNIEVITDSLSADAVGLDDTVFEQNVEKVDSAAQSYLDMKDAISMANESIQRDLGYIAEYADGYSDLSTEQQKFVNEFLKGFSISDIMSESNNPFDQGLKFDKNKMASVKSQITKFVEALSQDETTKNALADLYAIPTDEQSIDEFIEQFRNALEVIQAYCQKNGIEIPIAISDSEQSVNDLEAQYKRAVDFAKDKFDGYDPTAFFKEHSINTQEEIDVWQEIAQGARDATEAEKKYVQSLTTDNGVKKIWSAFTEDQSKSIDDFQSKVKTLGDTLSSLKSGEDIGLTDLIQEFPELAGQTGNLEQAITDLIYSSLQKLYDTLGESLPDNLKDDLQSIADTAAGVTPQLDTAFSAIQKSYDVLHDFEDAMSGSMTDNVLSSVGSLSQKLNDLAAGFYAGTVGADELYDALTEHYETDMENYVNALVAKNKLSGDFYDSIVLEDTEFVNTFKDNYGIDLTNYKSYHEAKLNIAIGTIKALGENWSRYYDAQALALTADGERLLSTLSQSSSEAAHKQYADIMSQISQFEQTMNVLDNVIYNGVEANFSSISSTFENASTEATDTAREAADTAKDQIDSYLNYMKSSLESGRTDYRTYANAVSGFLRNMFDEGKISAQEYHDYVGQMLETQKSILDRVADAVANRLDKEIDSLKDKMDEIEENYNSQIEYLDTVIEYHEKQKEILQDENDELDRQKALEEALYNLQRAQNQRTVALYTAEKGKIYVADTSAVRDAEDNARKAKLDIELAKIDEAIEKVEKQQDALKEAMDAEKEQLQTVIDRLEEYKKQWSSVASEYEDIQNDMLAKQVLGADYESKILDGRLDVLNSFKDEYLSIQKAIMDAAWESAKAQLEASQSAQNTQTAQGTSSSGTPDTGSGSENKKTSPSRRYRWYIYESGSTVPTSGPYGSRDEAVEILKIRAATAKSKRFEIKMEEYASGTKHARKGLNLVGEEGPETYIDNDGNISLVTAPSLISMEGGETVKNAEETKALLDSANLVPADTMASAGIKGETIHFTMDELRHRIQNALPAFSGMVQPDIQLPVCNFTSVQNTTPVVQNISLTLPNVTNTSGYERIKNELKQMQIDAYQAAHRK